MTSITCRSWKAISCALSRPTTARFAHYHVAGNPGRHEPDRSQEISYPAIYEAIAATDFEGYVGMEYIPRGEPVASLRAALDDFRAATT